MVVSAALTLHTCTLPSKSLLNAELPDGAFGLPETLLEQRPSYCLTSYLSQGLGSLFPSVCFSKGGVCHLDQNNNADS